MAKSRKKPIQIYLDPEQDRVISSISKLKGKSKAGIIRSCVSTFLESLPPEEDPANGIVNLGSSEKRDIAERHDAYLVSLDKGQ